jgi:O-antigen/teichoic acid export membrane protein
MNIRAFNVKNSLKNLVRDVSTLVVFKFSSALLILIASIILTNNYDPGVVGGVALISSFVSILSLIMLFGFNVSLLNLIPKYKAKYCSDSILYLFNKMLTLVLIYGSILAISTSFFSESISVELFGSTVLLQPFYIAPFLALVIALNEYFMSGLRALGEVKTFAILGLFPSIFIVISLILFVYFYPEMDMAPIYIYIIAPSLILFISPHFFYNFFSRNKNKKLNPVKKISIKEVYLVSSPMFLISGAGLLMTHLDILMIGVYMEEFDVGIYSIVVKILLIYSIIMGSVNSIVAPKFSHYYNTGNLLKLKEISKNSSKILLYIAIPLTLVIIINGRGILKLFGEAYADAYLILCVLVVGQLINLLSGPVGYFLNMTGNSKAYQKIMAIALLLNILLNLILIPLHGMLGAAISTTASIVIWNLASLLYMYRKFKFTTIPTLY